MFRRTLLEHERAVRYDRGRLTGVVGPGRVWYWWWRTRLVVVDLRPQPLTVAGQELLTADGVPVKVSVAAICRVREPAAFVQEARGTLESLYLAVQIALRDAVAAVSIEALLAGRAEVNAALVDGATPIAAPLGIDFDLLAVRDVMLPGEMKRLFAQVSAARQEGLAALERARGEAAALRSLANVSSLLERNPALLQLRTLQATASAGSTVVITNGHSSGPDRRDDGSV
jgi:regulator of protease activity HflC (stomatin/prohibitin superfamily)